MSGMDSDVQWFIAREGQQHGPLNEDEMRVFVERGHLRPEDLVWRQGFTDWRPASAVFSPQPATSATGNAPAAGIQQAAPSATTDPTGTPQQAAPLGQSHVTHNQTAPEQVPHGQTSQGMSPDDLSAAFPSLQNQDGAGQMAAGDAHTNGTDYYDSDRPEPRRGGKIAASLLILTIVGGAGAYYMKDDLGFLSFNSQQSASVPVIKAPNESAAKKVQAKDAVANSSNAPSETAALAPEPKPAAPPVASAAAIADIDSRLQQAELWQFIKAKHNGWYQSVLTEAGKIPLGDDFDQNLSKLLIKQFVAFRRKNAESALAASTGGLKNMANSFLTNLKDLSGRDAKACYTFISKGESSPAIIEIMKTPETSAPIHGQMLSIFKAVAEGSEAPTSHPAPEKKDYEALTKQLMKIGWSKEDIQLFASPAALSKAEPAKVCQMVQDWFQAHLGLEDPDTQERLLFETLRPVVAG
jgi:uncharacterized protein DUF4339